MPLPDLQKDQVPPDTSEDNVGISYSGGGPLLLIELGIAQAFVDLEIVPIAIAGVSAGAIAGTAHALDPVTGTGIKAAATALLTLSDHKLGLTRGEMAVRVLTALLSMHRLPISLADNGPIQPLIEGVFNERVGQPRLAVGDFGKDGRARLFIGGTNVTAGERFWFPDTVEVAEALLASSAIPGVFPPHAMAIDSVQMLFVDGAVAQNQPLSKLVIEASCGTLFACAVGYDGERQEAPTDALDNALKSISILSHESSRLEQGYVELTFKEAGVNGVVRHVHPDGPFPINDFNFTPDMIQSVMTLACQQTKDYIRDQGWMPPKVAVPAVTPVLVTSGRPRGTPDRG